MMPRKLQVFPIIFQVIIIIFQMFSTGGQTGPYKPRTGHTPSEKDADGVNVLTVDELLQI